MNNGIPHLQYTFYDVKQSKYNKFLGVFLFVYLRKIDNGLIC